MKVLLLPFYLLCCCLLIVRYDAALVFDHLVDIDYRKFINPCKSSHDVNNKYDVDREVSNPLFNKDNAMARIKYDDAGKLLDEVKKFNSFNSYLHAHFWNETDYKIHNHPPAKDIDMVWASPHSSPFAVFDLESKRTRLTWCDADETYQRDDFLLESLRNKRIVFYGDSIIRYQYLDLLHFLMYRKWSEDGRLEFELLHKDWPNYLLYTDQAFKSEELCECYRTVWGPGFTFFENRKYHDKELNTTIWFFLWFGDYSLPHGHFNISEDIRNMSCMPNRCTKDASKHPWMANSAADFIYDFVSVHSPDLVLLNTGVHTAFDGTDLLSRREVPLFTKYIRKLRDDGYPTKFVFRSTTPRWVNPIIDWRGRDFGALELAVRGLWKYFDATQLLFELFTVYSKVELASVYFNESGVHRGFLFDAFHYVPWINHEFNKLLIIELVRNIQYL